MTTHALVPVILSGGAGTRLWPVSREAYPKPFMHVGGATLLTQTYERARMAGGGIPPLIITNREYYFLSRDELQSQPVQPHYLLEPVGRNTAPAIALAALRCAESDPGACLLVMPADHVIRDPEAFARAVRTAHRLALDGALVLFGVTPTSPETGYGYIRLGEPVGEEGRKAAQFIEKPDAVTAASLLARGDAVWNSGMFCFRAGAILDAFARYCPELLAQVKSVWSASRTEGDRTELPASFSGVSGISIDYAVMERADNIAVVAGQFGWSDVGAWHAVAEALPRDEAGNSVEGEDAILIDMQDSHIRSAGRIVAAIGLKNVLVIDTPDALLVADKSRSQDVREVVARLRIANHEAHRTHRTVMRPWGSYTVLHEGPGYKIKQIAVRPGASLSLQMHHHRSEHWVVVSGVAEVVNGDDVLTLQANESTYIPALHRHRLSNPGTEELSVIEVQCGGYLGEDDIVRFEDVYGRAKA